MAEDPEQRTFEFNEADVQVVFNSTELRMPLKRNVDMIPQNLNAPLRRSTRSTIVQEKYMLSIECECEILKTLW